MKLIVGLGNPGSKYEHTRHNAGFRAVRGLHTLHAVDFDGWKEKHSALVSEGRIGGEKVALLLPQTFMNESGLAVRAAIDFWKLTADDVVVVSDDLDLPVGTIRVRNGGGSGGHNGLKSVFSHLGTEDVVRVKVGIAGEHAEQVPAEKYVLERFGSEEEEALSPALSRAAEAVETILSEGVEAAMNRYN